MSEDVKPFTVDMIIPLAKFITEHWGELYIPEQMYPIDNKLDSVYSFAMGVIRHVMDDERIETNTLTGHADAAASEGKDDLAHAYRVIAIEHSQRYTHYHDLYLELSYLRGVMDAETLALYESVRR